MIGIEKMIVTKVSHIVFCTHQLGDGAEMKKRTCNAFSFCIDGHITFSLGNELIELTPGSAILLPKNSTYSWLCHKTGIYPQINFETESPFPQKIIKFDLGSYSMFDSRLNDLQKALITDSHAKTISIFYDIVDGINASTKHNNKILEKSISYLLENFDDASLSNEILAKCSGISEIYFRKLFKESFGVTPKQYIIDLRIKKACKLLGESRFNISEIAEQCGFSSVYHFCRAFKKVTSTTPTQYATVNRSKKYII